MRPNGLCVAFALLLTACSGDSRTPLVIYSPHGRDLLTLFERRFEQLHPDVDVRWLDMGSQEVYERLRSERANPQADVWFGGPATIFARGAADSLLEPLRPSWAGAIDPHGRGPGDMYFAVFETPAVIVYAAQALRPAEAPQDWDDLLLPKWKGQVLIRDPLASGTMRAVWGMLIERGVRQTGDTAAGFQWLRRLDGQTKEYVLNGPLLDQKIVRREGLVTIWDLPDIQINMRDGLQLGYVFPKSGTPVLEDAIAVVRHARHRETARAFVEWVGGVEAQLLAAREVYRLPARADLPADSLPDWVRDVRRRMKVAAVDWDLLAARGAEWMRYWDEHVRGKGGGGGGAVTTGDFLHLDGLMKRWSPDVAVGPVSLAIARGEIVALLGPSGSGKTTLLRLLAGFETADVGRITVAGEDVTAVPPARRRFGMVFQHYALFPHLDVGENVAFGIAGSGERGAVEHKVREVLALVDLAGFERRKVQELSGGQQQRVALARALAPEPRVLLLDEPLSNLDPTLREHTRRELRALIKRVGITTLFVTHEQEEAFDLGDRIAVLNRGLVEQVGTADELYEQPASLFVATFVGRANVLRGAMARAFGGRDGQVLIVRPERLRFADAGMPGTVRERRYTGAGAFYLVESDAGERCEVLADPGAARVGERVYVEAVRAISFTEQGVGEERGGGRGP